jgi:hypothetical protein
MRRVVHPAAGKPPTLTSELEEFLVLLQGAIELANVERWVLEHGEDDAPEGLNGLLRRNAYEVTVVDRFHRLARRDFERRGYVGVWERPLQTGLAGRPKAIDVSLFDVKAKEEVRLELGLYTKTKLRSDAKKLLAERTNGLIDGYSVTRNLLALWQLREQKTTQAVARTWMARFNADASAVSTSSMTVTPLVASTMDLFVAEANRARYAVAALFEVG